MQDRSSYSLCLCSCKVVENMFSKRSTIFGSIVIAVFVGIYIIADTNGAVILISSRYRDISELPYYCKNTSTSRSRCSCNISDDDTDFITTCYKHLYLPIHPNTTHLTVKRANIRTVKTSFFKGLYNLEFLDISYNYINRIEPGSFKDLYNLKTLYLEGNDFQTIQTALPTGVFAGLSNVTVLTLNNCIQRWILTASRIKNETFADLVSLEELTMDGISHIEFDEGFKQLVNFKTLVLSDYKGACLIKELTNETFIGLEHLENLTIVKCGIQKINNESFSPLKNLRYLDLSENIELEFAGFGEGAYGLTLTNISVLKINSIHDPTRVGIEVGCRTDLQHFKNIPLKRLYMERNGIAWFEHNFGKCFPQSMEYLSLRENKLFFTAIFQEQLIYELTNLVEIDISDQKLIDRQFPKKIIRQGYKNRENSKRVHSRDRSRLKRSESYRKFWSQPTHVSLSLNILKFSGSHSKMSLLDLSNTINNITFMDLSRNYLPVIVEGAFIGFKALKHLNLSNNLIEVIDNDQVFTQLESLHVFDLNNNLLGNALQTSDFSLFNNQKYLKRLDLSVNRIYSINKNAFIGLSVLQTLDLSNNYISEFNCDLSTLKSLRKLNLANNRIHSISVKTRKTLDLMAKVDEVKLDLTYNDFVCNCDTLPFIRWLIESPVIFIEKNTYSCAFNNGTVRYFNSSQTLVSDLEEYCRSYLAIYVGSATGGSFLIAFVLCYLVYRYRWKLRYIYYMAKVKIDGHIHNHKDEYFDYDVFLSYADYDRPFVIKEMVEYLEKQEGIRLCIRDRDFEIGEMVAVNISKAIRTSKKTLLIVSRHFLKSKWCNFEMNIARMEAIHMHRKLLVVLFTENVPANALPIELIDILREFHSTDVPEDEHLKPAFWQTCLSFFKD